MSTAQVLGLIVVAVLAFWMVGAYNRLVALRNAIGSAWTQVHAAVRTRGEVVGPLVTALRVPLATESASLDAVLVAQSQVAAAAEAMAARPMLAASAGGVLETETAMASSVMRLLALLDLHQELMADAALSGLVTSLRDAEPRLAFARQLFNEAAQEYNDAARQFPTRLLARLYGFGTAGRL